MLAAALVLICAAAGAASRAQIEGPTEYYQTQVQAARQLEACFQAVKGYKQELGLPLNEQDLHQTGMIGESYTEITTTLGAPEAKRTTAWPDMAALCVRLLYEAGVRPGDTVGAGFSGSFPGMNLAVVVACESMEVELVCITSVGASTYGANNPELTFPEMMWRLEQDGLIKTQSAAVTMGGTNDVGEDMEKQTAAEIRARLAGLKLSPADYPEFSENLTWRQELYRTYGIDCFVAVGGNVTSLGRGESGISLGQGVLQPNRPPRLDENSGLIQYYLANDLPVINLLNIKQLVAEYGLPYDPVDWPEIGQSAVYWDIYTPKGWLLVGLVGVSILLAVCGWIVSRPVIGKRRSRKG